MIFAPHFSMAEVTRSATASAKGIDNAVPLGYRYAVGRAAEFMECIRALLGGHPIKVTSWFRCLTLNTAIGGSTSSAHMKGLGIDWQHGAFVLEDAFSKVADSALPFDQLILEGTADGAHWIHVGLSEGEPRREVLSARGDELGGPMSYTRIAEG